MIRIFGEFFFETHTVSLNVLVSFGAIGISIKSYWPMASYQLNQNMKNTQKQMQLAQT